MPGLARSVPGASLPVCPRHLVAGKRACPLQPYNGGLRGCCKRGGGLARPGQHRGKLSTMKLGSTADGRHPHPLAVARVKQGLSIRDLAERTGLTHVGISHIETGRSKRPHTLTKRALAQGLGYEVADIFPPEGKRPHRDLRSMRGAAR